VHSVVTMSLASLIDEKVVVIHTAANHCYYNATVMSHLISQNPEQMATTTGDLNALESLSWLLSHLAPLQLTPAFKEV
jgi:hypothetical protein